LRLEEETFRWMHNEDAMATEKLAEGIRKFNSDAHRLQQFALARVAETDRVKDGPPRLNFTRSMRTPEILTEASTGR
jgi:hypothetical protein